MTRWKAGASGGDYSFTQNKSDTTITIASNKSLMQVVEDVNRGRRQLCAVLERPSL